MMKSFRAQGRSGFTLLETTMVSGLMGLLVVLLSAAWAGLGRPLSDTITQCQVAQEANLAVVSLSRDLGGAFPGAAGRLKTNRKGKTTGKLIPDSSQLLLCFDDGDPPNSVADWGPPDMVVAYQVQSNNLVRTNQPSGISTTVAKNVDKMEVKNVRGGTSIKLTFKYRDLTRTYTIIVKDP